MYVILYIDIRYNKDVKNMNKIMNKAIDNALNGIRNKEGGPFGAVIVDREGNIISCGNNKVIINNDPTAHAEVVAIRNACQRLNTYDLSNYIMYTTCEPCPMCLGAIIWSNIKTVYYGCDKVDANNIGFRDDIIYDYIKGKNKNLINMYHIENKEALKNFQEFKENDKKIMY